MIDIDNPITYPIEIQEWIINHKPYFLTKIPLNSYEHEYEIIHKLYDMHIEEQEFIQNYIQLNKETEFTMWHNARIENKEIYFKNKREKKKNQKNKKEKKPWTDNLQEAEK